MFSVSIYQLSFQIIVHIILFILFEDLNVICQVLRIIAGWRKGKLWHDFPSSLFCVLPFSTSFNFLHSFLFCWSFEGDVNVFLCRQHTSKGFWSRLFSLFCLGFRPEAYWDEAKCECLLVSVAKDRSQIWNWKSPNLLSWYTDSRGFRTLNPKCFNLLLNSSHCLYLHPHTLLPWWSTRLGRVFFAAACVSGGFFS